MGILQGKRETGDLMSPGKPRLTNELDTLGDRLRGFLNSELFAAFKVVAPILVPSCLIMLGIYRTGLAVTDGVHPIGRNP